MKLLICIKLWQSELRLGIMNIHIMGILFVFAVLKQIKSFAWRPPTYWCLVTAQYRLSEGDRNLLPRGCYTQSARTVRTSHSPCPALPVAAWVCVGSVAPVLCVDSWVGGGKLQALFPSCCLSSNSPLFSDFHEWWGHPSARKSNSYFSNSMKASLV